MANFTMYDREREFKWQIECQLSGGTYAYIDADDIYSGRITRQISSGEGIEVGSCYVSELDLTIVASALPSNVVSVKPYFRLLTSTEIVDDVVHKYYTAYNLGVFKIASTKRKEYGRIDLVCYDKMADLDTLITPSAYTELLASDWRPFYLLDWIATKVGVTYTFTQAGIEAMPNGTLYFKLAEETSNIKTYRDLLQYVCMLIGAYAIFDEDGHLNVKTFADVTSYSLPASFRFAESFGDVPITYSGVELTVKNVTTMFGNANNTVVRLSDNPFLYVLSNLNQTTDYATFIMQFLRNIYTEFQGLSYYAGEFEIPPDASLNVGRLLAVTGGGASDTINCFLQKIDVNFDGRMALSCGNPNTYVTRTQNRTTSSITNLTNRIETLESSGGGNKIYTSTKIPTASDTANEGDLWYQMDYTSSSAFDFPDWGYTLPLVYNPGSFRLEDVRSSLELRFYDTVNDVYFYYLYLGGTNYTIAYNRLGPTNTFDDFDKDTGELQVTTENEQGTVWSYWNYIPRWDDRSYSYLIANPLGQGYSDHNMSPNVGTITYNIYSILGYASKISSGEYRLDGFRLITDGLETSWQYDKANDYNVITRWVYKENNWQVADYIAGEGVTIKNGIISANGSETVQVNPVVTSGTQLATINGTSIYAPTVSVTQTQTSGTEIAEINVGDTSTKLYAPETTVTQVLTEGTEIAQINGTRLYAPTGGGSNVTVTPKTLTGTNIADIEVDGTIYQLFAPSGGGGGGGSGSGYTETSLWSGYKSDTGTISLNDSAENYDVVLIRMTSHPEQPSNSYYESYFTILTKDIIYNQHWQYSILVVRGHADYGNGSMDCYFADSTSFVIEAINISNTASQVKPAVLEVIGLKFGGTTETALIYSNEERVVGVWTDNRPLYQKTYTYSFTASSNDYNYDIATLSSEVNVQCIETDSVYRDGIIFKEVVYPPGDIFYRYVISGNVLSVRVLNSSGSTVEGTVTIKYTKTTDTPGSAPYVTNGAYAHHYSTDEQVIGTWIDGSTLYEKTQYGGIAFSTQGTWYDTDITNIDKVVSVQGSINRDGEPINIGYWSRSIVSTWTLRNNTLKMSMQAMASGETYTLNSVTVRYTKTS